MVVYVSALKKRFGDVTILDGVELTLSRGESVALTGESGSGKSTLLHIVAGLEPPDAGTVKIDETDVFALSDADRARLRRQKIGIVFQQFNLIPSLTVAQNISFQARLAGESVDTTDLADSLGLTEHLSKFPEQLSGGQQQRVAIGRALAANPSVILADEPTGNLDETTGDAVFNLLLEAAKTSGTALLVVTHSTRLAEKADRKLHLSHGMLTT